MSTPTAAIVTALSNDATISSLATGIIIDWDDLSRIGLNSTTHPDAFDAEKRYKPSVFVKFADEVPAPGPRQYDSLVIALVATVTVIAIDDGDEGFSTIRSIINRSLSVIDGMSFNDWRLRYIRTSGPNRESFAKQAPLMMAQYNAFHVRED